MDWTPAQYAFHKDCHPDGTPLTASERAKLVNEYLSTLTPQNQSRSASPHRHHPSKPPRSSTTRSQPHRKPRKKKRAAAARLLRYPLHLLLHALIHFLLGIYLRLRRWRHALVGRAVAVLRYHHRSPDLIRRDVRALGKLPRHVSVVMEMRGGGRGRGRGRDRGRRAGRGADEEALEKLVGDVGEVAAWCAAAGIETLSVYERSGILKSYIPHTHAAITRTLRSYFGPSPSTPTLHLRAPHLPSYSPPPSTLPSPPNEPLPFLPGPHPPAQTKTALTILLLSATDGRPTLVDLTKTLAEMAQRGRVLPERDIGEELIDAEMREIVMEEPDLLVLFGSGEGGGGGGADGGAEAGYGSEGGGGGGRVGDAGVVLRGYPPWQLRLTEIFHAQDNTEVGYQVFLRALHRYARAQMRFGR